MKIALFIIGIILSIATFCSLSYAGLQYFSFKNTLDGSNELYARLLHNSKSYFIIGIILLVITVSCFIIRKLK